LVAGALAEVSQDMDKGDEGMLTLARSWSCIRSKHATEPKT
jgi:hypothetical protein